jgi:hypothetical protein
MEYVHPNYSIAESVNFDYLPGEPDGHKALYVTMREPPTHIKRGQTITLNHLPSRTTMLGVTANNNIGNTNTMYHVSDIHGRHVVVEPINGRFVKPTSPYNVTTPSGQREGVYLYKPRPQTQKIHRQIFITRPY